MSKQNKTPQLSRSVIMLLFVLLLAGIFISRGLSGAPLTPLDESYTHLVTARVIAEGNAPIASLYDYVLAYTPVRWLLPPLLGLLSFYLLGQFFEKKYRVYALLLFLITPLTLTLFTSHSPAALFLPVALFTFSVYKKGSFFDFAMVLLCILLPLIDMLAGIVVLLIMSLYALHEGRRRIAGFLILINVSFILFGLFMGFDPNFTMPGMFFGELGDPHGYSLFIILLAVLATLREWRVHDAGSLLLATLLFALSALLPTLRPIVLISLSLSAARALQELEKKTWALPFLKQATTLLLLCLGVFVVLSHTQLLVASEPTPMVVSLASELSLDERPGSALVPPDIAGSIEYFSSKEVVVFPYDDPLFSFVTLESVAPVLRENNVRFFVVSPALEYRAWGDSERGLRFLMLHNEKFINVFMVENYELWLVLPEFAR